MKKRNVVHLSLDDGATPETIAIADRRTMILLHEWRLMDYDMKRLLVSCYFQGIRDMAQAVIENPGFLAERIEEEKMVRDYQI